LAKIRYQERGGEMETLARVDEGNGIYNRRGNGGELTTTRLEKYYVIHGLMNDTTKVAISNRR
jgi:hypothetical protein